jgi:hypothetical protein
MGDAPPLSCGLLLASCYATKLLPRQRRGSVINRQLLQLAAEFSSKFNSS